MNLGKIISEELDTLEEGITSGQSIVWHRTKPQFLKSIQKNGYEIGNGDTIGKGIYACFDLDSQLNDYQRDTYGSVIIESKVKSLEGFLITYPQEAENVYGNKWRFNDQLKLVFNKSLYLKLKETITDDICQEVDNGKYINNSIGDFYRTYLSKIQVGFNGLVYNSLKDGKSIVAYNENNIVPLRYTEDEGETWKPMVNQDVYQRNKNKDIQYSNLSNKDIVRLLIKNPKEHNLVNLDKLESDDICDILSQRPELITILNTELLYVDDIILLVTENSNLKNLMDLIVMSDLDNDQITKLLSTYPEYIDDVTVSELQGYNINIIIDNQPQLAGKLKVEDLYEYQQVSLLIKHPVLLGKFEINDWRDDNLVEILKARPEFIKQITEKRLSKMNKTFIKDLLQKQPQLGEYFSQTMNETLTRIIKEELAALEEGITSGQSIVWHRTKIENIPLIQKNGYLIGDRNVVGRGIYACFDFESQLDDFHRHEYGNVIVECKIKSNDGFLIMFPQEAKNIYGKNWKFDNQLEMLFSDESYKKVKVKLTDEICEAIDDGEYATPTTKGGVFYRQYLQPFYKEFNGLIYSSLFDGKAIVCFNKDNIIPLQYTEDEGNSWKPMYNKDVHYKDKNGNTNQEDKIYRSMTSTQISDLLINQPELVNKLPLDVLDSDDIVKILEIHSEFIPKMKYQNIYFSDVIDLINYDVLYITILKYLPSDKLENLKIVELMIKHPQYVAELEGCLDFEELKSIEIKKLITNDVDLKTDILTSEYINKLDADSIAQILERKPELFEKLPINRLNGDGISDLIEFDIKYADILDLNKLSSYNIFKLLEHNPQLASRLDLTKFNGDEIGGILNHNEKIIKNFNLTALTQKQINDIITFAPILSKYFSQTMNETSIRIIKEELEVNEFANLVELMHSKQVENVELALLIAPNQDCDKQFEKEFGMTIEKYTELFESKLKYIMIYSSNNIIKYSDKVVDFLLEKPQFIYLFDLGLLERFDIGRLCDEQPQLITKELLDKLDGNESSLLLISNPELLNKINLDKLDGFDICTALKYKPQLIDEFDLNKLRSYDISLLLTYQPQLINKLDIRKLDKDHIKLLLSEQPQLKPYFDKLKKK